MTTEFAHAALFLMAREGGYTVDQGGPTNYGVTQATYNRHRVEKNRPPRDVRDIEMFEVLECITDYWEGAGCEAFASERPRLALLHLDFAYNSGPLQAIKKLQATLGVTPDGLLGPISAEAARTCDEEATCREYLRVRAAFLRALAAQPKYQASLKGWLSRLRWCARACGVPVDPAYAG